MTDVPRKWWDTWAAEVDPTRKKALEVAIRIRTLDVYRFKSVDDEHRFKSVDDEEEFLRSTAYRVGLELCLRPRLLPHVFKALQRKALQEFDNDDNDNDVKIYRAYTKALRALPPDTAEWSLGPTFAAVKREFAAVKREYYRAAAKKC